MGFLDPFKTLKAVEKIGGPVEGAQLRCVVANRLKEASHNLLYCATDAECRARVFKRFDQKLELKPGPKYAIISFECEALLDARCLSTERKADPRKRAARKRELISHEIL